MSWADTVGPSLAQVTALVAVERDGTLRCAAANEAALHDLLARQAHVLAAWNAVSRARGGPRAERLVAWVAAHFRPQSPPAPRPGPSRGDPAMGPAGTGPAHGAPAVAAEQGRHWDRAKREAAGVKDPELRAAFVRLRARALARGDAAGPPKRAVRTLDADTPPPPARAPSVAPSVAPSIATDD